MSHTLAGLHCIRVNFKRVYSNISQKPVAVLQERGGGGGGGGGGATPPQTIQGGDLAWLGGWLHIDQDNQKMDIRKILVTQEKSTDSVEAGAAAQESVDSVEGATTPSVTSSSRCSSSYLSGTFPNDLPVLVSIIHKQDILVKGPTQPSNCTFPRHKFTNGNLSFNPAWYDAKEAQGWLE